MNEYSHICGSILNKGADGGKIITPVDAFAEYALRFLKGNVSSWASRTDISVKGRHSELYSALPRRLGLDISDVKIYDTSADNDCSFCGVSPFSSVCNVNGFVNFTVSDEAYAMICREINLMLPKGIPAEVIEISETSVRYAHARLLDAAERGTAEDAPFFAEEKAALWECLLLIAEDKYSSSLSQTVRAVNLTLKPVRGVAPRIRRDAAMAMAGILYRKIKNNGDIEYEY